MLLKEIVVKFVQPLVNIPWGGRLCLTWLSCDFYPCLECKVLLLILSFLSYRLLLPVRLIVCELFLPGF